MANVVLPAKLALKDWQTLYQPKLNIACLSPEKLFLRVVQLPAADFNEARSMIELQLEKLSPVPVMQAVWSFELLPKKDGTLRTAILVVAARTDVEEFLGKIEGVGFLADRLEIPFLDQLLATKITANGVWVYPGVSPDPQACLVAWWYDGILHSLAYLHVPEEPEAGPYLRQQIAQMAWAGELEGWLTPPPRWHLVAPPELAATWAPWLRAEGEAVETVPPLTAAEVAALTAKRAISPEPRDNLLPPEFAARYRQQFIDRIWMRGLGAMLMLVLVGTVAYLASLQVLRFQVNTVEKEFLAKGVLYTNASKIKAEVQVLQDQVDLQFAALECWKAVATSLPEELTLNVMNFQKGRALLVSGNGPAGSGPRAYDYNEALRKAAYKEEPLFNKILTPDIRDNPGQGMIWTLNAELKRNVAD